MQIMKQNLGTNLGQLIQQNHDVIAAQAVETIFEWLRDLDREYRSHRRAVRSARWLRDRAIMEKVAAQRAADAAVAKAMQAKKNHRPVRLLLDEAAGFSNEAVMLQGEVMQAVHQLRTLQG